MRVLEASRRLRFERLESRELLTTMQPLGDLPGGSFGSYPSGVSADGSTVVGYSVSGNGAEAFVWSAATGEMRPLGALPGEYYGSYATGVTADGSTVVGHSLSYNVQEAVTWTAATGEMRRLSGLPDGYMYGNATHVSADGSTIVGEIYSDNGYEVFVWTAATGQMRPLREHPGGYFESYATGVSADGSTIVGYFYSDYSTRSFVWTAAAGMRLLAELPGFDFESYATGVSADGSTIVGYSRTANGALEAFIWSAATGQKRSLGELPGGYFGGSFATGVSADGSTVVGNLFIATGYEAFIWTAATEQIRPLGDLPGGIFWSEATGVSADGLTVVGDSFSENGREAFRLVVEPGVDSDLQAGAIQWDGAKGGVSATYHILDKKLNNATNIALYWAGGDTFQSAIGSPVTTTLIPSNTKIGAYTFRVGGSLLNNPPPGATHLLLVLDPPDGEHASGLISESDEGNNTVALIDVSVSGKTVSEAASTIIKEALRVAGQSQAIVTSTTRTIDDQARVMFENLEGPVTSIMQKKGLSTLEYSYALYDSNGDKVIDVYKQQNDLGSSAEAIKAAMATKIRSIKSDDPTAFKHTADPSVLEVVDVVFPSGTTPVLFERAIATDKRIARHYSPFTVPVDQAFHIEIPKSNVGAPQSVASAMETESLYVLAAAAWLGDAGVSKGSPVEARIPVARGASPEASIPTSCKEVQRGEARAGDRVIYDTNAVQQRDGATRSVHGTPHDHLVGFEEPFRSRVAKYFKALCGPLAIDLVGDK